VSLLELALSFPALGGWELVVLEEGSVLLYWRHHCLAVVFDHVGGGLGRGEDYDFERNDVGLIGWRDCCAIYLL